MTANVLPDQVARFRRAGMNGHVGKPFKREELYAAIEQALNPARSGRAEPQPGRPRRWIRPPSAI